MNFHRPVGESTFKSHLDVNAKVITIEKPANLVLLGIGIHQAQCVGNLQGSRNPRQKFMSD